MRIAGIDGTLKIIPLETIQDFIDYASLGGSEIIFVRFKIKNEVLPDPKSSSNALGYFMVNVKYDNDGFTTYLRFPFYDYSRVFKSEGKKNFIISRTLRQSPFTSHAESWSVGIDYGGKSLLNENGDLVLPEKIVNKIWEYDLEWNIKTFGSRGK